MKKKLLLIMGGIIVLFGIVFAFFIYPKIVYNKDIDIIKNKITLANMYLLNNASDIKIIKEELKKESVSNSRLEIEKETNKYLNKVIDKVNELNILVNDEKINNVFNDEKLKESLDDNIIYITDSKEKIESLRNEFTDLDEIDDVLVKNEDNKKILHDLFNENFKILNYNEKISKFNEKIDSIIDRLTYLKKNKDAWKYDSKIIFNKRINFNEYKKLSNEEDFELIKDTTGPVIKASNLSITKGAKINIKDKVSCTDAVDGKMECKISGNYDTNKTGSYNIKITSTDLSKNTSSKTIKLTVNDKIINKKPYYIEVIRNQNIVIVYGLDKDGEYKKVVKVFTCSVGKSSTTTPTGTYKTQDKAKWGWLIGNLYGQYYTRIVGSILFHSVPYTKKAKNTLEWDEYNKLGSAASKGCIRLSVRDVKWIYDNCPRGTTVKIYDGKIPSGITKPSTIKISADSPNKGWDPTDPDKNNPWKK